MRAPKRGRPGPGDAPVVSATRIPALHFLQTLSNQIYWSTRRCLLDFLHTKAMRQSAAQDLSQAACADVGQYDRVICSSIPFDWAGLSALGAIHNNIPAADTACSQALQNLLASGTSTPTAEDGGASPAADASTAATSECPTAGNASPEHLSHQTSADHGHADIDSPKDIGQTGEPASHNQNGSVEPGATSGNVALNHLEDAMSDCSNCTSLPELLMETESLGIEELSHDDESDESSISDEEQIQATITLDECSVNFAGMHFLIYTCDALFCQSEIAPIAGGMIPRMP